ncbi:MAG TPA: Ig-like domain-containing protein [Terracidiphilus sp.]|jgi:hypothetical protein|nr:Ig-like domain-containing protein [Terracidiphilus sp.]
MFHRLSLVALLLSAAVLQLTGCSNPSGLDSISVTPATQTLTAGQTVQFSAIGTYGNGNHLTSNAVQSGVTWVSSSPSVVSVSATGLATAMGGGTASISASAQGFRGPTTATATVTVTAPAGSQTGETILSLVVIPSTISVGDIQDTGQFLAIGTFSTPPYVRDVTNLPTTTWISSFPNDFPVDTNTGGNTGASAGIVTAYASGSANILVESTSKDGTIQTAQATFNCPLALPNPLGDPPTPGSCYTGEFGPLLSTLTVYQEGLNTTNWEVTAPSATGTEDVIHCGPGWALNGGTGGSVCTATYPLGTTVTLTAPATGAAFGGWSNYCAPTVPVTAGGTNSCQITLGATNATVGAIFN